LEKDGFGGLRVVVFSWDIYWDITLCLYLKSIQLPSFLKIGGVQLNLAGVLVITRLWA